MTNTISIINRNLFQRFPYHLVEPSNWPILVSFSLLNLTIGAVAYMHGYPNGGKIFSLGLILTIASMVLWFRDVITEGTYLGCHTLEVQKGLIIGFILFIISEVFAFLSVFWAFFHSSLSPAIEIGGVWPRFLSLLIFLTSFLLITYSKNFFKALYYAALQLNNHHIKSLQLNIYIY